MDPKISKEKQISLFFSISFGIFVSFQKIIILLIFVSFQFHTNVNAFEYVEIIQEINIFFFEIKLVFNI
jgi:hypothetical protein